MWLKCDFQAKQSLPQGRQASKEARLQLERGGESEIENRSAACIKSSGKYPEPVEAIRRIIHSTEWPGLQI